MTSAQDDRDLVVAYLHHTGAHTDALGDDELWAVYCEAEGFGHLDPETLSQVNEGWDWSHVRDSTPEGWGRMAAWLRDHGFGPDGPTPRPS